MHYLIPILLIIGGITALFAVKTFIGAVLMGLIDIIAGLAVIGLPAGSSFFIPQTVLLYLGPILVAKGVYSIVSGFR